MTKKSEVCSGGHHMGIDYSGNIISISDEEGNNYQLEHLDTFEFEGRIYMAFVPADLDIDDPGYGLLFASGYTAHYFDWGLNLSFRYAFKEKY